MRGRYLRRHPRQVAAEDIEMLKRNAVFSARGRPAAMATVAGVAVTAAEPSPWPGPARRAKACRRQSAPAMPPPSAHAAGTIVAAAAAPAAFAGIVGTGLAIAAAQNRPAYYGDCYGRNGGGPAYYGGGPLRRIWLWGRALLPGPSLGRLVRANLPNRLIRRSLWRADSCSLALAVNTQATGFN
jgi:hypothetical protein